MKHALLLVTLFALSLSGCGQMSSFGPNPAPVTARLLQTGATDANANAPDSEIADDTEVDGETAEDGADNETGDNGNADDETADDGADGETADDASTAAYTK